MTPVGAMHDASKYNASGALSHHDLWNVGFWDLKSRKKAISDLQNIPIGNVHTQEDKSNKESKANMWVVEYVSI